MQLEKMKSLITANQAKKAEQVLETKEENPAQIHSQFFWWKVEAAVGLVTVTKDIEGKLLRTKLDNETSQTNSITNEESNKEIISCVT